MSYLLLAGTAALLSLALTPLVRNLARRMGALDLPSLRKVHTQSVPRLGGVSVAAATAITLAAAIALEALGAAAAVAPPASASAPYWAPIVVGGTIIFFAGLIDDLRELSPRAKLSLQAAGAVAAIALGVRVETITLLGSTYALGILASPITFAWILIMTNAFNLVDGLDGLAGGLAIIAATTCGLILVARGDVAGGMLLATLAGALCGFLPYNLTPASIFLGDSGSLFIGYVLGVTAVTGFQKGATALAAAVPLLIFALPIAETLVSASRRFIAPGASPGGPEHLWKNLVRRLRRVLEADRAHFHHRLVDMGLSARSVVLVLYALSLLLGVLALASAEVP